MSATHDVRDGRDVRDVRAPGFDRTRVLPFPTGDYAAIHRLQESLVAQRIAAATPDLLLLGEHERVVTLGRSTKTPPGLLPIPVISIERGGQATWHGPGQLVVYPILGLIEKHLAIRDYLRALEEAILRTIAHFGVSGERREGATGVWVAGRKVASIGVAVRRHVTWHGLALNVRPDLADFQLIEPCGFAPDVMTSLERLLGEGTPTVAQASERLVQDLVAVLRMAPPSWEPPPEIPAV